MKLIIDIPEEIVKKGFEESLTDEERHTIIRAVGNGTPLPKGHGRLVDENHVIAELVYRENLLADNVKCGQVTEIFNSAVVIDADKG